MSTKINNKIIKSTTQKYIDSANTKEKEVIPHVAIGENTLILGATKSGKSFALKKLILTKMIKKFDEIYIFSPTAKEENWERLFSIDKIYESYDTSELESLENEIKQKFLKRDGDSFTLLIFDDCVSALRDPFFGRFLSRSRHYGITTYILCQYSCNIKPDTREQIDTYIISNTNSLKNVKNIIEMIPVDPKKIRSLLHHVQKDKDKIFIYYSKKHPGNLHIMNFFTEKYDKVDFIEENLPSSSSSDLSPQSTYPDEYQSDPL